MANAMTKGGGYLSAAAARRDDEGSLTQVAVPEFAEDGQPPVIVYGRKPTPADRATIERLSLDHETGKINQAEAAVRTVIQLACDESGARLFTVENAQFMRTKIDADVIEALAFRLNAGLSLSAAKKN